MCDTDNEFSDYTAHAICRLMGYSGSNSWSSGYTYSMQYNYAIRLDNVNCDGSISWSSCSYDFEVSDCRHHHDVYIDCVPTGPVITDAGNIVLHIR